MGFHRKKESVLLVFALLSFMLFLMPQNASAEAPAKVCCIVNGVCDYISATETTLETCTAQKGVFDSTHACNEIPDCSTGVCCELDSGAVAWKPKALCDYEKGRGIEKDEAHCSDAGSQKVKVSGKVIYNGGTAAEGSFVQLFNSETKALVGTDTADSAGLFEIWVAKSQKYKINVSISQSSTSVCKYIGEPFQVNAADYNAGNLNLPCSPAAGCLTKWTATFPAGKTCGPRTVTSENNCPSITLENKPAEYVPCTVVKCNNGVLEEPVEQCDIINGAAKFPEGTSCKKKFGATSIGSVSCSEQCTILYDNCTECTGECNDKKMCHCENHICDAAPICQATCDPKTDKVTSFTAVGAYKDGIKGFTIGWSIPPLCSVSTIRISRCIGDNDENPQKCSGPLTEIKMLPGSAVSYSDFTINQNQKSYCYNISVQGKTVFENFVVTADKLACAPVRDKECLEVPDGTLCGGDNLLTCEKGQLKNTDECSCGCRDATVNAHASCVIETEEQCNVCDVCSGPFGIYSHIDYYLGEIPAYKDIYGKCSEDLLSVNGDEKLCYRDEYSFSKATVGQYKACFNVSDCYDYKTKTSCTSNPCGIKAMQNNCEWHNLTLNNELGIGVCVPVNPQEQDCTKCNDDGQLGNYCPMDLCMLYGNGTNCYYNNDKKAIYSRLDFDNATCMNVRDVACETYDTKLECIGANSINFTADIIRNTDGVLTGGTHAYQTLSDDKYKKGKCVWVNDGGTEKCLKDADKSITAGAIKSDCKDLAAIPRNMNCFKDFINPVTQMNVLDKEMENSSQYSYDELAKITVNTSDTISPLTFVSVSAGDVLHPSTNYNQMPNVINQIKTFANGAKENTKLNISFYSMDSSANLETVKVHNITLIPSLNNTISMNFPVTSAYSESYDAYLSNIIVTITNVREVECKAVLTNNLNTSKRYPADSTKKGTSLTWTYESLLDSTYSLDVRCEDAHIQTFANKSTIIVDADRTIHDAEPRGAAFRPGNIAIKLKTNASAQCFYLTNQNGELVGLNKNLPPSATGTINPSSAWKPFTDSANGLEHTAQISETSSPSGLKFYYPACYFPSYESDKWFTYNAGDVIFYAIDSLGPNISLVTEAGVPYNFSSAPAVDSLNLKMLCNDNDSVLLSGTGANKVNYAFGCSDSILIETYYVKQMGNVNETTRADFIRRASGDTITITPPDEFRYIYLNITGADKGKNNKTYIQYVNVRNLSFIDPFVQICDPETDLCS